MATEVALGDNTTSCKALEADKSLWDASWYLVRIPEGTHRNEGQCPEKPEWAHQRQICQTAWPNPDHSNLASSSTLPTTSSNHQCFSRIIFRASIPKKQEEIMLEWDQAPDKEKRFPEAIKFTLFQNWYFNVVSLFWFWFCLFVFFPPDPLILLICCVSNTKVFCACHESGH